MTIETDLANATLIVNFVIDTVVDVAIKFMEWPLVLVPSIAIAGIVFAKARGIVKLRK